MEKIDKFYEVKNLFQCPRCGKKIRFHDGGLVCKKEHRFDISAKGYVNLLQENKSLKGYDKGFFASRFRFLQAGYYSHIMEEVVATVERLEKERGVRAREMAAGAAQAKTRIVKGQTQGAETAQESPFVVLDAGCGEGYYASEISKRFDDRVQVVAFDISTDAVKQAAKSTQPVKWLVADITNIPMKEQSVDCILDVFTPANYKEFVRILKPGGALVKVVPGPAHMGQLREAAAPLLRNKSYTNEEVLDYFEKNFELVSRTPVSRTLPIDPAHLSDLGRMTPLLFDVDKSKLDLSDVKEITVEAEVLVGKAR